MMISTGKLAAMEGGGDVFPGGGKTAEIYFGGGRRPSGCLRDLLADRIRAVPAGGSIDWVAYYFRDRRLAGDLLAAHRRGVRVTVTMEKQPRTPHANEAVAEMLAGPQGLGAGFRLLSLPLLLPRLQAGWKPHLHEKLYCFSHPEPVAFLGSYNPSGDQPEKDPDVVREIGDQDRGYNVLVGLKDPRLVARLTAHSRSLHRMGSRCCRCFAIDNNLELKSGLGRIFFLPSLLPHPAMKFLHSLGSEFKLKCVFSHLKGRGLVGKLVKLAGKGHQVEILADSTSRRVPASAEKTLKNAGIAFHRLGGKTGLPMHDKFILAESAEKRWVVFGSFNWTPRSWWLNQEIGMISADENLCRAFADRWNELSAVVEKEKSSSPA